MDIIKKNLLSVICGVIALAALVAVFIWPLNGYYDSLEEKAKLSAAKQAKIASLLNNKSRTVPNPNPRNPDSATPLLQFPSKAVIQEGEVARAVIDRQAKIIYKAAVGLNEKKAEDLAVPGALPRPASDTLALRFHELLEAKLDAMREKDLGAGIPPTPQQIEIRKGELWDRLKADIRYVNDQPTNLPAVTARYNSEAAKIPEQMQQEFATLYKIYVDPANKILTVPDNIPTDKAPSYADMWWAQVEYWVAQDVVSAVAALNQKSKSVTDAPIKQIRVLRVPQNFFPPPGFTPIPGADGMPVDEVATGVEPDPTAVLPDGSSQSPTKRISNPLFDVIQFDLSIDIEADQVVIFLKRLATNKFITVLNMEIVNVDPQLMQLNRFVYGPRPVVTLTLKCEALFLRHWTIQWMPDTIRTLLKAPDKNWKKPELVIPEDPLPNKKPAAPVAKR